MDFTTLYAREGAPPPTEIPRQPSLTKDQSTTYMPQEALAHVAGSLVPQAMLQQGGTPGVLGALGVPREAGPGELPLQLPRDVSQQAPSSVLPQAPREMLQQAEILQQASMEMLQKASREILMQAAGQTSSGTAHEARPPQSAPAALHTYLENRV